jgi:ATP-dependent exoDNAse (exonuclease V) beta subunit
LLKKRTHLAPYEEGLRNYNIPFVAVKGIGFYQETEIAILRALVFFLSNPHDDYSLYMLLKSPLFNMDESFILQLTGIEGESLFEKMGNNRFSSLIRGLKGLKALNSSKMAFTASKHAGCRTD